MSSEISGNLKKSIQTIWYTLDLILPGSVSGSKSDFEIIHEAEDYDREYYTGVFGIFSNGIDLAMIRFIEEK
jgi:para-aminobenzoate synthetase component 1